MFAKPVAGLIGALFGVAILAGCAGTSDAGAGGEGDPSTSTPSPNESASGEFASSGPLTVVESYRDFPSGVESLPEDPEAATWVWAFADLDDATVIHFVTQGSSSCPMVPLSYGATDTGEITVVFEITSEGQEETPPEELACTMDFVPTTSVTRFPEELTIPDQLTVRDARGLFEATTVMVEPLPAG
jgi:hypothetical protein